MAKFKCDTCGQFHDGLPMDLAFARPADFFKIPPDERSSRIKMNDDLCVIDDAEFIVRGVLELPIIDSEERFSWGIWAIISEQDFKRYLELWDSDEADKEPPFAGKLSGGIKVYPESDLLDVKVKLQSGNKRPLFITETIDNQLGIDQNNGITMAQVHRVIEQMMPHLFDESS